MRGGVKSSRFSGRPLFGGGTRKSYLSTGSTTAIQSLMHCSLCCTEMGKTVTRNTVVMRCVALIVSITLGCRYQVGDERSELACLLLVSQSSIVLLTSGEDGPSRSSRTFKEGSRRALLSARAALKLSRRIEDQQCEAGADSLTARYLPTLTPTRHTTQDTPQTGTFLLTRACA